MLIFPGCGERQPTVEELLVQADELLSSGQIDNAILVLERCQEIDPGRADVLENLAFAYAANGDPMLASLTFSRIAEIVPERPEYLLYSAESLIEGSDVTGAVSQYESYLSIRPEDRAVWVTLAELQEENGRLGKALEALLAAEQVESRAQQQIAIGKLYLQTQNLVQAQAWFARALEGNSAVRDEALLGLLETAVRAKRFSDAEALLTRLDAEYPGRLERSELDNVRDQLQEWRRRQDETQAALAALESGPGRIQAGPQPAPQSPPEPEPEPEPEPQPEPSVVVAPPPVEQPPSAPVPAPRSQGPPPDPNNPYLVNLDQARRLMASGTPGEAIQYFKQALLLDDSKADVWAELSEAYLEAGGHRWAQATASEAMRREPDNPKWTLQFLRAAQRTMEAGRLIREMEEAYRRFPNQPEIMLVLARAYRDDNNIRNARILYERFLDLAPENHPERAAAQSERQGLMNW